MSTFAPTDDPNWSVGGQGGKGHPGSLGSWDVLGNGLDKANPAQGVDTDADEANAEGYLNQAANAYANTNAPNLQKVQGKAVTYNPVATQQAQAAQQGPSNFGNISTNPAYTQAQTAQMAALSNLARNGGRNAASDASLASIQQNENANAAGQRGAIMQNMEARGQGGSSNSLLAQLSASQNATNNQSARDMDVAGQQANTALQAGQGAAQIGAGLHQQDYSEQANKAQAQDAVDRFNAGNSQTTNVFNAGQANDMGRYNSGQDLQSQEYNSGQDFAAQGYNSGLGQTQFQDQMGINAGNQAGGKIGTDYWGNKYKEDQQTKAGFMNGVLGIFGGLASRKSAHGGGVPGVAPVHGDSYANDTVPVMTSPGEVVIPRSLVQSGTKEQIHSFVKHPPPIGDKNKEAMLGALKNLRSRR